MTERKTKMELHPDDKFEMDKNDIKYYDIKNPSYKGIRGRWEGADPQYVDGMSDNFKAFKDANLNKIEPQKAAFETWTGKQAYKQGFTKANVITDNDNLVLIEFTK